MFHILEAESGKPFKVKGIAMRKNVTSKNGWHYSDKIVEDTVNSIKESINKNGSYPINMMADHPGIATNKVLSIIGKITDIYMDGNNAVVEAEIANTSVGKDVQELIRGGFVEGLSIRASNAKFKQKYIGTRLVKDVLEMELKGVDLVANPSVDGARITDIIESDQTDSNNLYIEVLESEEIKENKQNLQDDIHEEEIMDINELKSKYPQLVEDLKAEFKQVMESENQAATLQESIDALSSEKTSLEAKLQESESQISTLTESLNEKTTKLQEAEEKLAAIEEETKATVRKAHIDTKLSELKFADSVKDALRKKVEVLESVEEIDKVLESEIEFLNLAIKSSTGVDLSGKGKTGENSKGNKINEEENFINLVNEM